MSSENGRPGILRPGLFGAIVAADARRNLYDARNEQLIGQSLPVATVFAGDSITEWWALEAFFTSPIGLVVNRGIGGDVTPFLRRRFAADVIQLAPKLLVLHIGINNTWDLDAWADPSLLKTPEQIEDDIVGDITAMLQHIPAGETRVALGSLLPTDMWALASNRARNELIVRANRRLRDLASSQNAVFVDYHAALVGNDGYTLRSGLADDGLHPHLLGYRLMAGVLLDALTGVGITWLLPVNGPVDQPPGNVEA